MNLNDLDRRQLIALGMQVGALDFQALCTQTVEQLRELLTHETIIEKVREILK